MQDYVNVVEQNPRIEDAAATLRWTGSWYTVFIAAEPINNAALNKTLRRNLTQTVNEYRLAGQDVLIEPPQYVSLLIELTICVAEDYLSARCAAAVDAGARQRHAGQRQLGLFSADNRVAICDGAAHSCPQKREHLWGNPSAGRTMPLNPP